jgi:hypothetical protein
MRVTVAAERNASLSYLYEGGVMKSKRLALVKAIAVASGLLSLGGCNSESSGGGHAKQGLIRTGCGPADGPAVIVTLSDSAMECGGASTSGSYLGWIQNYTLQTLKVDFEYRNIPVQACSRTDCGIEGDSADIRVTDTAGAAVKGTYRIFNGGSTVETGEFELRKCFEQTFLCG